MKLSEIYGKSVCSADGGKRGYVIKVYTDGKVITGMMCADEHENEFYMPSESARRDGDKFIFTYTEKSKTENPPLALGRGCYNGGGEFIGILRDISCKGFKLSSAKIGTKNYSAENLVFGDVVIVKTVAAALKSDVIKDGGVIFKSGETADKNLIARAISLGEYVQTNLKTI